jgi:hypothetical protein
VRRLYLRIYLAMLASLAIFALIAALGWQFAFDREGASRDERALIAEVVAALLPPADALPDAGGVQISLQPRLTGALPAGMETATGLVMSRPR